MTVGKITGVHTVGVPVTDQDRAIGFYVGTLGLGQRIDADMGGGRRWIEVAPEGSAVTIALVAAREGILAGVETGIRFTAADADAVHAGMLASGVDAAGQHPGVHRVCVGGREPDPGLHPGQYAFARRHQRNRDRRTLRRHLDPAAPAAHVGIYALA